MATTQRLACGVLPGESVPGPCGDSYVEPGWIEIQNIGGNVGPHYRCTWCVVRRSLSWNNFQDNTIWFVNLARMYGFFPIPQAVNAADGGRPYDPLWPVFWPPAPPA